MCPFMRKGFHLLWLKIKGFTQPIIIDYVYLLKIVYILILWVHYNNIPGVWLLLPTENSIL